MFEAQGNIYGGIWWDDLGVGKRQNVLPRWVVIPDVIVSERKVIMMLV